MTVHDRTELPRSDVPTRAVTARMDAATVLIVDDQPANVTLLERIIREAGINDVHGVTDPLEAVDYCLAIDADLVLLDLHMPHKSGFALMAELGDRIPDDTFLPVLVLTADTTIEAKSRALSAGAKDFLTKPFDRVEVALRVFNLLETRMLYADLKRHTTAIQADLDHRLAHDRRVAVQHRERNERIDSIMRGGLLTMVFQPIADLRSGATVGVEALARFDCEPRRPPNEWFAEAAVIGRGTELELAAVHAALSQLDKLPPDLFMSINVSPETATAPELARILRTVPGGRVVLELTEHTRIADYDALLKAFEPLRLHGVRIAVDDAGAGYSSFHHVLRVHPDMLKLDTALTRGIHDDPARRALGTALVTFARELDATVIAEGIETPEELTTLQDLGIGWGQGYHLSRPGRLPLDSPSRPLDRDAVARSGATPRSSPSGRQAISCQPDQRPVRRT